MRRDWGLSIRAGASVILGCGVLALVSSFTVVGATGDGSAGSKAGVILPGSSVEHGWTQHSDAESNEPVSDACWAEPSTHAVCFAPGTPPEVIEAAYEAAKRSQDRFPWLDLFQADDGDRWSSTAVSGGGLGQGDPTILTWSYVPDGTYIYGYAGEPGSGSDLYAWLNGLYGGFSTWHALFVQVFDRWSELTGITYVYEPADDGAAFPDLGGQVGVRGDIRIGGHFIDGNSGILAYNFYPPIGDMILDSADSFYNDTSLNSRRLRNVFSHEHGHGLGLHHVCPVDNTKLLEPYATSAFDGPQHDDILGGNRLYGDPLEHNDTSGTATYLGSLGPGGTAVVEATVDDDSDADWYGATLAADSAITVAVRPLGHTYLEGPQIGGSCTAGTPFNSLANNDLGVEVRAPNGTTVLAVADANPAGQPEAIVNLGLTAGSGTYFVRVYGNTTDKVQLYELELSVSGDCDPPPVPVNPDPPDGAVDVPLDTDLSWEQGGAPIFDGGLPDQADGNEMTLWLQAEDFVLSSAGTVRSVRFWTGEDPGVGWDGTCTYAFHSDAAGAPGSILDSGSVTLNRTMTGNVLWGFADEYENTFNLPAPLALNGGTTYWLSLHMSSDCATRDDVYWESTSPGFGSTGMEDNQCDGSWSTNSNQHAFQLYDTNLALGTAEAPRLSRLQDSARRDRLALEVAEALARAEGEQPSSAAPILTDTVDDGAHENGIGMTAGGGGIVLDAVHRGWWRDDGVHESDNDNTITGQNGAGTQLYNSYFIFDLSGIGSVTSAMLRLEIEAYFGPDASEILTVYDVSTDAAVLEASGMDVGIYNDLMTGMAYATFTVTPSDVGAVLEIPLNAGAVADINAAGAFFSVGLHVNDIGLPSGDEGVRFSSLDEPRIHQLVLSEGGGCPTTYDVYFGMDDPPSTLICSDVGAPTCDPGQLDPCTTYHWQVCAKNPNHEVCGPVWHFTTEECECDPPPVPVNPDPVDGAENVPVDTDLTWSGGIPGDNRLYGIRDSFDGAYLIDIVTGVPTLIGPSEVSSSTVGLAHSGGLVLYGSTWTNLTAIQTDGSGVTVVGPQGMEGMAYDVTTGTLYGTINGSFFTVDPATGARITNLLDWGDDVEGMAFDPSVGAQGSVYGITGYAGSPPGMLYRYDVALGTISVVGDTGLGDASKLSGLAYAPDLDVLFHITRDTGDLYSIDKNTAMPTFIANTGITGSMGFAGLAYGPAPPSTELSPPAISSWAPRSVSEPQVSSNGMIEAGAVNVPVDAHGNLIGVERRVAPPAARGVGALDVLFFLPHSSTDARVAGLGYNVTATSSASDLTRSNLQNYDVLWVDVAANPLEYQGQAAEIRDWVSLDGGALIVVQPSITGANVSVFPPGYEVVIYDTWWPGDTSVAIADPLHPIVVGLTGADVGANADWVRSQDIGGMWHIVAVDAETPSDVALLAGEYGTGRLVFSTGNYSMASAEPGADQFVIQMIDWAGGGGGGSTGSLTTTFAGGNFHDGNMFDLTAKTTLTITSWDGNFSTTGGATVEVYYVTDRTSYVGKEQNGALWTLLGSVALPSTNPAGTPTPVPIGGLTLAAGETVGIYFTTMDPASLEYTNGPLGVFENAELRFEDRGTGNAYPFGDVFTPRVWNGTIYYAFGSACPTTYDVYFGMADPPTTLICSDVSVPTCDPGPLSECTTYYWQVCAKNPGHEVCGPVWHFTTEGCCPVGGVVFGIPPNGVVDARQPHPPAAPGARQGIDTFLVAAPAGAADNWEMCWSLCETAVDGSANFITNVVDYGGGAFVVTLDRSISIRMGSPTMGAVTTITYTDDDGTAHRGVFTSHPGNVNADTQSAPTDILKVIDYINGAATSPWGIYSEDVDHSGLLAPPDILRVIDLLNGAGAYDPWLNVPKPVCGMCCP